MKKITKNLLLIMTMVIMCFTVSVCASAEYEHDYRKTEVVLPTCDTEGYDVYECADEGCQSFYRSNYVAPLGHIWIIEVGKEPTCTEEGYVESSRCTRCDVVFEEKNEYGVPEIRILKRIPHQYIDVVDEKYILRQSTCTEKAVYAKACQVCGTSAFEGVDINAPDFKMYLDYQISHGGKNVFLFGEVFGHSPIVSNEAKNPTCTEGGYTEEIKCQRCGDVIQESEEIAALGHIEYTTVAAKYPTCTEKGNTAEVSCERCGNVVKEMSEIPSYGGHKDEDKDNLCDRCDYVIDPNYIGEGLTWSFDEAAGKLTISGEGAMHNFDYEYAPPWRSFCDKIKIVVIEDGVTTIGDEAFEYCYNLTGIEIPESVTTIGEMAFAACMNLKNIILHDKITTIGFEAFAFCVSLESIVIPESVTNFDGFIFEGCTSLKTAEIKAKITEIPDSTFMYCSSLEKVTYPETVTSFGEISFAMCINLKNLNLENITNIGDSAFMCSYDNEFIAYKDDIEIGVDALGVICKGKTKDEFAEIFNNYYLASLNACIAEVTGDSEKLEEAYKEYEKYSKEMESLEFIPNPDYIIYGNAGSTAEAYAAENGFTFKLIDEYEEPHTHTFGEWYTEKEATVFEEGVLKRVCSCEAFETKPIAKLENDDVVDTSTGVEITYTETDFTEEVKLVVTEDATNANIAFSDVYENYKSYDITLTINDEAVQPNGYITVKLPLPEGFNAETTAVYYVDDMGNATLLTSSIENGYVIFETNHFSEYVIVDESSKIEAPIEPDTPDEPAEQPCTCKCHKNGFMNFIYKILNFFKKLFGGAPCCECN